MSFICWRLFSRFNDRKAAIFLENLQFKSLKADELAIDIEYTIYEACKSDFLYRKIAA